MRCIRDWRRIERCFFFSSRRRHTRFSRDWSSDVCSSDLACGEVSREDAAECHADARAGDGIDDPSPGFWLIRGAGGSGTTTTALPRLKFLVRFWRERRVEMGIPGPVRVLVLTFNRTLRGYIEELTQQQIQSGPDVALEVSTFAAWAQGLLARVVLDRTPME